MALQFAQYDALLQYGVRDTQHLECRYALVDATIHGCDRSLQEVLALFCTMVCKAAKGQERDESRWRSAV